MSNPEVQMSPEQLAEFIHVEVVPAHETRSGKMVTTIEQLRLRVNGDDDFAGVRWSYDQDNMKLKVWSGADHTLLHSRIDPDSDRKGNTGVFLRRTGFLPYNRRPSTLSETEIKALELKLTKLFG